MGERNYLIEGVSCSGKTMVCRELKRRGYHAINGDTELAYRGNPLTGEPIDPSMDESMGVQSHEYHIWDTGKVRALAADQSHAATFFCGGSRNFAAFIDLFDRVFVLDIDQTTLDRRLAERPASEWGGREAERQLIRRLHATKEDLPTNGVPIDATAPLSRVVDQILQKL
ncbi:MAG: AAA family ATPase [Sphingomicrobium sp.]